MYHCRTKKRTKRRTVLLRQEKNRTSDCQIQGARERQQERSGTPPRPSPPLLHLLPLHPPLVQYVLGQVPLHGKLLHTRERGPRLTRNTGPTLPLPLPLEFHWQPNLRHGHLVFQLSQHCRLHRLCLLLVARQQRLLDQERQRRLVQAVATGQDRRCKERPSFRARACRTLQPTMRPPERPPTAPAASPRSPVHAQQGNPQYSPSSHLQKAAPDGLGRRAQ